MSLIELAAGNGPHLYLDQSSVLDVAGCFVDGVDISPGEAVPDDGDARISRSVQGFLFSCGPDHIRHREPIPGDPGGKVFPLHGSAAGHAARILSTTYADNGAECVAQVDITTAEGGTARLHRTWRIDGVSGEVHLSDEVFNTSTGAWPVFWMYHMNIGGRFLAEQTRLEGAMLDGGGLGWRFGPEPGGIFCVPAPVEEDGRFEIRLGPLADPVDKVLRVRVQGETLRHLQIWRNQKTPVDVLGIEPVSHRWVGREELRAANEFHMLESGQSRCFGLSFAFL